MPTRAAMSATRASGSVATASSTWPWLVRKVQDGRVGPVSSPTSVLPSSGGDRSMNCASLVWRRGVSPQCSVVSTASGDDPAESDAVGRRERPPVGAGRPEGSTRGRLVVVVAGSARPDEHTSELQSRQYLVFRLLLETKN